MAEMLDEFPAIRQVFHAVHPGEGQDATDLLGFTARQDAEVGLTKLLAALMPGGNYEGLSLCRPPRRMSPEVGDACPRCPPPLA
jgi:hypothetical protein